MKTIKCIQLLSWIYSYLVCCKQASLDLYSYVIYKNSSIHGLMPRIVPSGQRETYTLGDSDSEHERSPLSVGIAKQRTCWDSPGIVWRKRKRYYKT